MATVDAWPRRRDTVRDVPIDSPVQPDAGRVTDTEPEAVVQFGVTPIEVPMVAWDRDAEPLLPIVRGGLRERAERRLARELIEFHSGESKDIRRLITTICDVAGVRLEWPEDVPQKQVRVTFSRISLREILDSLANEVGMTATITEWGSVTLGDAD